MMSEIKDSGERREFDTGAVRDIQEGKGRCDLLPLDVVASLAKEPFDGAIFMWIHNFCVNQDTNALRFALNRFCDANYSSMPDMMLDVSKHFEDGAKKYGERNWEKGIPIHCYIDSAVRHYLKHLRGDTDERHDRAFVWNLLCCIWTMKHKPELFDL